MDGKIPDDPPVVDFGVDYPFAIIRAFTSQRGEDRSVFATGSFLTEPLDFMDNVNTWETVQSEEQLKFQQEKVKTKAEKDLLT